MIARVVELALTRDGTELLVICRVTPGHPGRISGPPEKCYPPEPADMQVQSVSEELTGASRPDLVEALEADDKLYEAAVEAAGEE
jgi:hypothetical protein